jgi:protein gp37
MSANTKIEWTDRTWNPTTGCTKVSPGCDHCYAETLHERFHGKGSFATVTVHEDRFDAPLRWRKPAKVFVNSMSDVFHANIDIEDIAHLWAVMTLTPQHTYQVLTKRAGRMRSVLSRPTFPELVTEYADRIGKSEIWDEWQVRWPPPNVWLGVSTEDQHWADIRIPLLLETPAAVHWISAEPLLGPINLRDRYLGPGGWRDELTGLMSGGNPDSIGRLDWVVVGGESGPGARPMHPDWARSLRHQCWQASVPFHFKQWGANNEHGHRVGKTRAGRLLDGIQHDAYPTP